MVAHYKDSDFSVVLFRPNFMLASEEDPMKAHKNQWVLPMPCPLERLSGATSRGQTMASGDRPSQCAMPYETPKRCTHNLLCTRHFHGVPFASPHAYSLKSRYGKVSFVFNNGISRTHTKRLSAILVCALYVL